MVAQVNDGEISKKDFKEKVVEFSNKCFAQNRSNIYGTQPLLLFKKIKKLVDQHQQKELNFDAMRNGVI